MLLLLGRWIIRRLKLWFQLRTQKVSIFSLQTEHLRAQKKLREALNHLITG